MDSAYLKNHVGVLLAKGIAETVTAQPSNPQEYLALFLLHQLQEEERRTDAATRKRKANEMRESWEQQRALREKAAVDVIQRGLHGFQARLRAKRAAEEELREAYEAAEAEAEELLDQESAIKAERGDGEDAEEAGGGEDVEAGAGSGKDPAARAAAALAKKQAALLEARGEFFKSQRFLLTLDKGAVGRLKGELVDMAERVRMGQDATLGAYHRAAAQEAALVEAITTVPTANTTPALSPAAAALAERLVEHRDHRFLSVSYVNYLVLRCVCYLLLNATPKATSTAAKVAALLKPSVLVQQIRAFNPVATYDRGVALRLERLVPELAAGAGGGDGDEDGGDGGDGQRRQSGAPAEDEGPSVSFAQPPTRQVRRAARVLRLCWLDGDYQCEVDPEDYYTEEMVDEDAAKAEADGDDGGAPVESHVPSLASEIEAAAKARERAAELRETVAAQVKQRGGVVLYGLLRFVSAAVAYRQARDAVVQQRQGMGLSVDTSEELPEEEAEDPMNDEALVDEESGEPDVAGVLALQERIGVDTEEALVKVWEARDTRQREAYEMTATSLQRRLDAGGEEEEEEADAA
ncbi:Dpy-30 motif containing protein [Novymonas esmeraldas]|uniref:Dpy-30 motif containing protein n=1 Tax=Novymonas esmeraldas TaxID=1808958 RepID=A0AAW0EWD3_9TRYP